MAFRFTAASSSRITKSGVRKSPLKKGRTAAAKAPKRRGTSIEEDDEDFNLSQPHNTDTVDLDYLGGGSTDLLKAIEAAQTCMFSHLPDRATGMNSTGIAKVLNLRRDLPRVVSKAQLRASFSSATTLERQIVQNLQSGRIRKIVIPLKAAPGGVDEIFMFAEAWIERINQTSVLDDEVKEKLRRWLRDNPSSSKIGHTYFDADEATALVQAGLLTIPGRMQQLDQFVQYSGYSNQKTVANLGSSAASGSEAATGGVGAVHDAGGSAGGGIQNQSRSSAAALVRTYLGKNEFNLTLPGMGVYIRLLDESMKHIMKLLSEQPKRQCSMEHLKERWNGGVSADSLASKNRKARGQSSDLLPGQTRKWRQYYGLSFEWIIRECVGRGSVELFNTGAIGIGVRKSS